MKENATPAGQNGGGGVGGGVGGGGVCVDNDHGYAYCIASHRMH